MEQKCEHCNYAWDYLGKMTLYANCPNCRKAVRLYLKGELNPSKEGDASKEKK